MSKRRCLQVRTLTEAQGQCDIVQVIPAQNTIHCSSVLKQGIPQATKRETVLLSDILVSTINPHGRRCQCCIYK